MSGARIQLKRSTAASWTSNNPVLFVGEIGYETDTKKFKIGDGSTAWTSLTYSSIPLSLSSINDLGDVTISSAADGDFLRWNGTAWINDAVNLGTDTAGSFVQSLVAGTGVTLTNNSGENTTPTIAIGQSVGTGDSPTFVNVTAALTGNASTATTLQTSRNIAGQAFNGSANISIAPTDLTGVTSSAAEINILDGATLSTTELNYVDGVTSAIQTQIDTKAPLASPTFTGTVTVPTPIGDTTAATKLYVDTTASTTASNASTALTNHEADTTNIHGIADTSILVTTTGSQTLTNKTITTPSGLVKNDVGLGNVDNTSDANKPVSTAGQTALDLKANIASPTFTGSVTVPTPTSDSHAATKAYADAIAAGINWHNSVETATAAALPNTPTYSNGTSGVGATLTASANARLVMDGANVTTGDRVLVKDQADATQNGIYVVTAQGSVSVPYVLTRASDHDNLIDEVIRGDAVYVANGSTNVNQGFIISSEGTGANDKHVLGTDDMNWSQFTGAANITAGTGITKTGNTLSIGQSVATNASVTFSAVTAALTGNASTATILETARNIAGQSFNGSANISIAPTDLTGVTSTAAEINILDGATLTVTELNYVDGVTSAIQTQIDLKAPLASPTFTGTVTIPSGASISGFAPLASPTFTGTVTIPTGTVATTQASGNNSTAVATTAFVTDAVATGVASATVDNLDDIADVVLTAATSGQFLKYNGTNWVNDAVPIISNIDDITGVTITAAADKDFLMYNGTAWVDQAITLGTDTTGSYVASLVAGTGVTLTNNTGESATPTIAIGQAVATNSNVTFNDLTVSGNLTVSGTTTSINTETVTVDDNIIILNNNATGAPSVDAGIEIERGTSTNVLVRWNETTDKWEATNDGSTYGNLVTTADSLTVSAAMIADVVTNAQTASYTLVLGDKNKIVEMNVASGNNLTVPPNSSVAYPVGTQINILQVGAGQTTVVQGAGVTVNAAPGLKLRTQWSYATLIKRAENTWVLVGDISA